MGFKKELKLIQKYISNFDVNEFSSSADFVETMVPTEKHLEKAQEIKSRMNRRNLMAEAFKKKFENEKLDDEDVRIRQEEIDALLASRRSK